jgi:hypothetical protein
MWILIAAIGTLEQFDIFIFIINHLNVNITVILIIFLFIFLIKDHHFISNLIKIIFNFVKIIIKNNITKAHFDYTRFLPFFQTKINIHRGCIFIALSFDTRYIEQNSTLFIFILFCLIMGLMVRGIWKSELKNSDKAQIKLKSDERVEGGCPGGNNGVCTRKNCGNGNIITSSCREPWCPGKSWAETIKAWIKKHKWGLVTGALLILAGLAASQADEYKGGSTDDPYNRNSRTPAQERSINWVLEQLSTPEQRAAEEKREAKLARRIAARQAADHRAAIREEAARQAAFIQAVARRETARRMAAMQAEARRIAARQAADQKNRSGE